MAAKVLASLAASVKVNGRRRTLRRGEAIPEGLDPDDRERLSRRGSIVSADELRRQEAERTAFKEAGTGTLAEEAVAEEPEPTGVEKILAGNVEEVLDAVGEDKDLAEEVLDAERQAESPRKGIVEPLEELLEA